MSCSCKVSGKADAVDLIPNSADMCKLSNEHRHIH